MTEKEDIENALDKLEEQFEVAKENGLFEFADVKETSTKLRDAIVAARKALDGNDNTAARTAYYNAEGLLDGAVKKAPRSWRISAYYGIPFFLYLLAFLIAIGLLWNGGFVQRFWIVKSVPAWAPMLGLVGALLRGLWWLWYNVNRGRLRIVWLIWFISAPFIGLIMGLLTYLMYAAGFIAATQKFPSSLDPQYLAKALSALGGFNWEWVVKLLNKLAGLES